MRLRDREELNKSRPFQQRVEVNMRPPSVPLWSILLVAITVLVALYWLLPDEEDRAKKIPPLPTERMPGR